MTVFSILNLDKLLPSLLRVIKIEKFLESEAHVMGFLRRKKS